jgi:NAD-dependent deacetylase
VIQKIQRLIKESKRIICITGQEAMVECGGIDLWNPDNLYRIEKTYGKSPEEMLSAGELTTRKTYFYDFYKNEVLKVLPKPGPAYEAMKKLQKAGKLLGVVSFNIFGLEELAGLSPVWELSGSVYDNFCPVCKKKYTVDFVKQSKGVPLCDECKASVRPNIRLHSEKVRNDLYTQATSACQKADMILVLGTDLSGSKMRYCTGHYDGDKLVVIHKDQHFSDKFADYVIYANPGEVLPQLVEKL